MRRRKAVHVVIVLRLADRGDAVQTAPRALRGRPRHQLPGDPLQGERWPAPSPPPRAGPAPAPRGGRTAPGARWGPPGLGRLRPDRDVGQRPSRPGLQRQAADRLPDRAEGVHLEHRPAAQVDRGQPAGRHFRLPGGAVAHDAVDHRGRVLAVARQVRHLRPGLKGHGAGGPGPAGRHDVGQRPLAGGPGRRDQEAPVGARHHPVGAFPGREGASDDAPRLSFQAGDRPVLAVRHVEQRPPSGVAAGGRVAAAREHRRVKRRAAVRRKAPATARRLQPAG